MGQQTLTIKSWAEEDRPREKLLTKGRHALSDSELVAILIGSGNDKETAVDLAKRILSSVNNNLNELGKLSIANLKNFKGIGEAKAIGIIAALELGRRRQSSEILGKPILHSSIDSFQFAQQFLADLPHEKFLLICLNRRNQILHHEILSSGGVSGTVVDLRMVLKIAIENLASYIVVAHNHPSGNLRPSLEDDKLTKQLKDAAKLMNIGIQDHLIIGNGDYFSYADELKL